MKLRHAVLVALSTIVVSAPVVAAVPTGSLNADSKSEQTTEQRFTQLSDADVQQVRDLLAQRGVDAGTIDTLAARAAEGYILDADNPDAEPVSSRELTVDGGTEIHHTFADGSVAISTIESSAQNGQELAGEEATFQPARITVNQCRVYAHDQWYRHDNCLIRYDGISFSYSFRADFSAGRFAGAPGVIRGVRMPVVHRSVGANAVENRVDILRSWQHGNISAEAVQTIRFQAWNNFGSWSVHLRLHVLNNRYWTSH